MHQLAPQLSSRSPRPARLAARLVSFYDRAAPLIVLSAAALFAVSVWYTVARLGFTTDRNDIMATHAAYQRTYLENRKEFDAGDDIVVVVSGSDPVRNRRCVDAVVARARRDPQHFRLVVGKLDLSCVHDHLLLYLPLTDLVEVQKHLAESAPFLRHVLEEPGLAPLFVTINDQVQRFASYVVARVLRTGRVPPPERIDVPGVAATLPILDRVLDDMAASLLPGHRYQSPWSEMLAASSPTRDLQIPPRVQYLEFGGGRTSLVVVRPVLPARSYNPAGEAVAALQRIVQQVGTRFPKVHLEFTGKPVIESDEMVTSAHDSGLATLLSLGGVLLLFGLTFKSLGRPFLATLCLIFSMGWTLGFTTLAIGHMNILTVTVMPMLVGLGIDFGIQIITRYEEERLRPRERRDAMAATLACTGLSILTAGLTIALSFLALYLTDFKGIKELAVLAGGGILLSVLAMEVVLPALILLVERHPRIPDHTGCLHYERLLPLSRLERGLLGHPWGVVALGLAFTGLCLANAHRVHFDFNVLHLQNRNEASVALEQHLMSSYGQTVMFAEAAADHLDEARVLEARLLALPTVSRVVSVVPLIPDDQDAKVGLITRIQQTIRQMPPMHRLPARVDVSSLGRAVSALRGVFLMAYPRARRVGQQEIADGLRRFVSSADLFLDRVESNGFRKSERRLRRFQHSFFHDLESRLDALRAANRVDRMTVADLPQSVRSTLVGRSGRLLLQIYPREDVWEERPLAQFLHDLRTVDVDVTGTPVIVYESTRLLRSRYDVAALYAFLAIAAVVLLQFRRPLPSLLVLCPLVLGLIWMQGIMGLFGIVSNAANYLSSSLILGVGVANGIYIVRRYQEEGTPAIFTVSTGRAILLSNLTAMMGFGSLMTAQHQGMYSLGVVMTIGIGACVVASLAFLPALLQLLKECRLPV